MSPSSNNSSDIFDMLADAVNSRHAAWRQQAACRGSSPTLFFPKQNSASQTAAAKRMCARCPVIEDCKADWQAMPVAMQKHGVWWGTTDQDRRPGSRRKRPTKTATP